MKVSGWALRVAMLPTVAVWNLAGQESKVQEVLKVSSEYFHQTSGPHIEQRAARDLPPALREPAPKHVAPEVALDPPSASETDRLQSQPGPLVVGVNRRVKNEIENAGGVEERSGLRFAKAWTSTAAGTSVWRLAIRSPGAAALRVHFRVFAVGNGRVWVLSAQSGGAQFVGPYRAAGPYEDGEFWSGVVFGEAAVIEFEPDASASSGEGLPFQIVEVSHIWRDLERVAPTGDRSSRTESEGSPVPRRASIANPAPPEASCERLAEAAPCHLDSTCYPEWEAAAGSTALIIFQKDGVAAACSGTMMADRDKETWVPYFITAGHCVNNETVARTVQSFWRYQTASCGGQPPSISNAATVEGASYVAGRFDEIQGDFSLLRLQRNPSGSYWFSGWDAAEIANYPVDVATIHHPKGTHKRIALGKVVYEYPFTSRSHEAFATVRSDLGRTEQGSSGAAMRNKDYLVGILSFGLLPVEGSGETVCDLDPAYTAYARLSHAFPVIRPFLSLEASETEADLTILLSDNNDYFFNRGGRGEYVIRVTNSGVGPTVGGISVLDTVPDGLAPVETRGAGWNCEVAGQEVRCVREDSLLAGQSFPDILIGVQAALDLPVSFRNKATVSGGGESRTYNNTAERQGNAASDRMLTSGQPMRYSLPASTNVSRFYADEQYIITLPTGANRLEVTISQDGGGPEITAYLRAGRRVTVAYGDKTATALVRVSAGSSQTITVAGPAGQLAPGPYYIALERPGSSAETTGSILATVTVSDTGMPALSQAVNAASQQGGPIAPGEMVSLLGRGLGPEDTVLAAEDGMSLPTELAGVEVFFDEIAAPIFTVNDERVTVQVPYGVADRDRVTIRVRYRSRECEPLNVAVSDAAPGLFTMADGSGRLIAMHGSDTPGPGGLIVPENPADPGEVMLFWGTGEGQTSPPGEDGHPYVPPCPRPVLPVKLFIGGQEAEILYAGSAPGMPGILQVKARIPSSARGGDAVPVEVVIGGYHSQANVYTAIRGSGTTSPPTVNLSANPSTIRKGGSSTLSWSSIGATTATIDQGIGTVQTSGSRSVSPSSTTTYTITVHGEGGNASASATVVVELPVEVRPAEMLSPAPGSTLPGSSVIFQWSAGSGIDEYFLRVGNGVDRGDIYEGSQAKTLSVGVNGIPTDGRTVYVRLLSRSGTDWHYRDYAYKAFESPSGRVTPGVWLGSVIGFNVSSDGTSITRTGSSLEYGASLTLLVRNNCPSGGTIKMFYYGDIPLASGSFQYQWSFSDGSKANVSGTFTSNVEALGVWSYSEANCTINGSWRAVPAGG